MAVQFRSGFLTNLWPPKDLYLFSISQLWDATILLYVDFPVHLQVNTTSFNASNARI
jgi:hypothetical protein